MKKLFLFFLPLFIVNSNNAQCPGPNTLSITQSPAGIICSGESVTLMVDHSAPTWGLYYENDFETSVGSEWSTTTTRSYNGGTVLGEFGNTNISLDLTNLPDHDSIRIEFDLYIADTWDGYGGPDIWNLTMGGNTIINATFAACCTGANGGQSYPDNIPVINNAETGATITNLPDFSGSGDGTDLYQIIRAIETSTGTYTIQFSASGLQSLSDESWGIDNVKIYLYSSNVFDDILWSTTETNDTITVNPLVTTSYWVSVDNGSTVCTDSVLLEVLAPTITQSPAGVICSGESVTLMVDHSAPIWGLYYENDFETSVGSEWSTTTTRPYNLGTVLGEFGNSSVTLNLTNLPDHDSIRVEFDLYIADTWDGYGGPDVWNLAMGGATIIDATFAACCTGANGGQSYPDNIPAINNAETGATTTNLPDFSGSGDGTDLYQITRAVETSTGTFAIQFSANGLQTLSDESWGIDNVKIYLYSNNLFDDILWSTTETNDTITVQPLETTSYWVSVDNGVISCTDSIAVTVLPFPIDTLQETICDFYTWSQTGLTYNNSGFYYDTVSTVGCDSVYVLDLTILSAPPVITCLPDINAQTSDDGTGDCTTTVLVNNPSVTDDCDVPTVIVQINGVIENPNTYLYPIGTTQLEWIATDNAGNSDTCYQNVNISDNEPPILINCPLGLQVDNDPGQCGAIVSFSDATFSDNCTGLQVNITSGLTSGSLFPIGLTMVVYTATDVSGNQTTCQIPIVVDDVELPTFTGCPNDTVLSAESNSCNASFIYPTVDVNDNCPGTTLQQLGIPSGGVFPLGVSVVSWIATDTTGNADTCSFTVTVIDDLPPNFLNCPSDISAEVGAGTCDGSVSWTPLNCEDNCSYSIVQISGIANGGVFPLGTTFNQFVATDPAGNTDTCSFNVTITDNIAPSIICPSDIVVDNQGTNCGPQVVTYSPPTSTDNCTTVTNVLLEGLVSGAIFPLGITNISYVASDDAGNTDTCSFTITVNDPLPPPGAIDSIFGPTEICNNVSPFYSVNPVANALDYQWTIIGGTIDVGATGSSMTNKKIFWGPQGPGHVIVQAVNNCYASTPDTLNVTIYDASYPVDAGPDSTTLCAPINTYTLQAIPPTVGVGTWSVIQGGATIVDILDPYSDVTNLSPDTNIFRWTVVNVICTSFDDIYVIPDTEDPNALCQNLMRFMPPSGSFTITPQEVDMGSTDNCFIQSLALSQSTFNCLDVGVATTNLLVTDSMGNVGSCSANITIIDTIPPNAICQDITVQLNGLGEYSLGAQEVNGGSVDNCIIDSLLVEPSFFNCTNVGTNQVTLIVVDESGNRDSCIANVTIQDSDGPTINACNNATLYLDSTGTVVLDPNTLFSAIPTDPCGLSSITTDVSQNTFTCDDVGPNVIMVTATDNNGNQSTCSSIVTIVDNISPVVMCSDTTLILDSTGSIEITDAYIFDSGSWDSCGITQFVAFPAVFDCGDVGQNTVTVTITDANGNSSTCTPTVTILSNFTSTMDTTVCESYIWNGTTYTNSGTYSYVTTSTLGCDSIATLNLTINNNSTATDSHTACDSFTWIDGITYTSSNNIATHTLINSAGCDSLVTLDLTITNSNSGTDIQIACDSYTWIDGITYTSSNNIATHTLSNAAGCDSIVILDLTITNSTSGTDIQTACDSYTWIDGITYTSNNNSATHTLSNAAGCDSLVTLDLTINNASVSAGTDQTICLGDTISLSGTGAITYTWNNGVTDGIAFIPNTTATYTVTGTDTNGCVNTDQVTVTVNSLPTVSAGTDQTVCEGEPVTLNGSGAVSYTWDNGITDGVPFYATTTTTYTVTGTDANGCSTIDTVDITVTLAPAVVAFAASDTVCVYEEPVSLSGSPAGGIFSGTGVIQENFSPPTAGIGTHNIVYSYTDTNTGCIGSDSLSIVVLECTSIESIEQITLDLFPNPTDGQFTLQMDKKINGRVEITNNIGQVVIDELITGTTMQFDLSSVNSRGVYFVKVYSAEGVLLKLQKILYQ